jgi:hypothetical protein
MSNPALAVVYTEIAAFCSGAASGVVVKLRHSRECSIAYKITFILKLQLNFF